MEKDMIDEMIRQATLYAASNEISIKSICLDWEHFITNSDGSIIKPKLKIEFSER